MGLAGRLGSSLGGRAAGWLGRVALSALGSCGLIALACLGTTLTTASAVANLLLEPFSLLLVPGLVAGLVYTAIASHLHHGKGLEENHDFSARFVVIWSAIFYFLVFCRLARRRGAARLARSR